MAPLNVQLLLRNIAMFSQLPNAEIERLSELATLREVAKDEVVINLGEKLEGFYVLVHGTITISVISPQGDSRIIEFIHAGQSFGEALLFLGNNSPVEASATEAGKIIFLSGEELIELATQNPRFSLSMLAGLSIHLHKLVTNIQMCSLNRAHQRVIGYLLSELDAQERQGDARAITLPASKKMVASKLDLTPETFSRVLHELGEKKAIQVDGKNILILNAEVLRHYVSIST